MCSKEEYVPPRSTLQAGMTGLPLSCTITTRMHHAAGVVTQVRSKMLGVSIPGLFRDSGFTERASYPEILEFKDQRHFFLVFEASSAATILHL